MSTDPSAAAKALAADPIRSARWQRFTLLWLVFCCGVAVMGLEMTASQLIKPYFGSTISVWTSLIGLVMIFLTIGYALGGALADHFPSRHLLGALVLAAGLLTMILPLLSRPVLMAAWSLTPKAGLLVSSLVGAFLLFSVPNVLLGCVCPFAMKLSIRDLGRTGRAAGNLYAVSAVGSVIGTFLPALVMIDRFGVRHSIMGFGALLIAAALLLLSRIRYGLALAALLLFRITLPPLVPVKGMIASRESPYNYLQVVQVGPARLLIVDWGVFSAYVPGVFRTGEYYDYLLLAPLLRPERPATWLHRVLIIGLGAGTVVEQVTQAYGPVEIDGVEIDPAIVALGRRYFGMTESSLRVHTTDGRAFLASSAEPYDWVIIDAYQGSDIPSHLVTKEFFQQVRRHLSKRGVLSLNLAWWKPDQTALMGRLAASMGAAFPRIYAITGISDLSGAVLLASGEGASPDHLRARAERVGHAGLAEITDELSGEHAPRLEAVKARGLPLTDDRGMVTGVVDRMYRAYREASYEREVLVLGR